MQGWTGFPLKAGLDGFLALEGRRTCAEGVQDTVARDATNLQASTELAPNLDVHMAGQQQLAANTQDLTMLQVGTHMSRCSSSASVRWLGSCQPHTPLPGR